MDSIVVLFVHILAFCLCFGLLYWIVTLISGTIPPPAQATARAVMLVLLALLALSFLLGEFGIFGPVSWGYSRHSLVR
jgi:hypothetical protein